MIGNFSQQDLAQWRFTFDEIYQFAIRTEQSGAVFYRQLAQQFVTCPEVYSLFEQLAQEEMEHEQLFAHFLKKQFPYENAESYPEAYFQYARALAEGIVFSKQLLQEASGQVTDVSQALDFAMAREQASIDFFVRLRPLVDEPEAIDQLIKEEEQHLSLLRTKRAAI
jgi:rubrerythrin